MISFIDDLHMLYSIDAPMVQHLLSPRVPNDRPFSLWERATTPSHDRRVTMGLVGDNSRGGTL